MIVLTGAVARPGAGAGAACWLGDTSCRQSGRGVAAAATENKVVGREKCRRIDRKCGNGVLNVSCTHDGRSVLK